MQVSNSATQYGAMPKAFHWATVLLVITSWLLGQLHDYLPHSMHAVGTSVHISIGMTIFALLVARLAWRFSDPPPPSEKTKFGPIAEIGAKGIHVVLYGLLLAIPIMGVVVQFARGHGLPVFGLFEFPSPWARDRAFAKEMLEIHETMANALMLLVGLHAAAALTHHYVLRDRTLRRMLPGAAH